MRSALCAALLAVVSTAVAGQLPSRAPASARLPDTPVGRVAAEFVAAINGGEAESRAFARKYEAEDSADSAAVAEAVRNHAQVRARTGGVDVAEVVSQTPMRIEVRLRGRSDGRLAELMIELQRVGDGYRIADIGLRPVSAGSSSGPPLARAERAAELGRFLAVLGGHGFSGGVLVGRGDEVLFEGAVGMADRANRVPNSAATVFNTGSLSKQFTAAAILRLEMDGRLRTTDSIGRFLPAVPADKRGITLHHLLTHSSGLPPSPGAGRAPDRDAEVAALLARPLAGAVGERFRYANDGYVLLAAVVERASGMALEDYLREKLWAPAGMTSTGIRSAAGWVGRPMARYYVGPTDNGTALDRPHPNWKLLGAGGVLTTLGDMHRWYRALRDDAVLSRDARRRLFTPALGGYAYGWGIQQTPWGTEIEHDGGSTDGVAADMRFYPDSDLVVVSFANDDGETTLLGAVRSGFRDLAMGRRVAIPPAPVRRPEAELAAFVGAYALPGGGRIHVSAAGSRLELRPQGQAATDVVWGRPADADAVRAGAELTERLFGAAMRDDSAAVRALVSRRPALAGVLGRWREQLTSTLGAFQRVEVLGTRASTEEQPTDARLHFANGSADVTLAWVDGELAFVGRVPAQRAVVFAPLADGTFGSYDFTSGATRIVRFERGALVIGDVRATRK